MSELVTSGNSSETNKEESLTGDRKEDLKNRLRRCIGQLESVLKMVDSDPDCGRILTQLKAARRAADAAARIVLACHLSGTGASGKYDYRALADLLDY
ncbi:MAG: metal-sensitive transcriptional regulator [bacterium]|jgi:DNA-binding FrmR family transcriptional regulator